MTAQWGPAGQSGAWIRSADQSAESTECAESAPIMLPRLNESLFLEPQNVELKFAAALTLGRTRVGHSIASSDRKAIGQTE